MRYELYPRNTVVIRGPASIMLLDGQATILGATFPPAQRKTIPIQKQLPIETTTRAKLEIAAEMSTQIFEIPGSTIPTSWSLAAATLVQMRAGKVVVIGPPDVGKSTLCVYLVNKMLQADRNVRVVDADIGQADVGPPTTISHAVPHQSIISLQELDADRRLFIGDISPNRVQRKLIRAVQRLSDGNDNSLMIVNTDGWVGDLDAMLYKVNLLMELKPDLVLGLEYSSELESILGGVRFHSLKIGVSREVLERSRVDRRSIRNEGYRRFLDGAYTRHVDLEEVPLSFPQFGTKIFDANASRGLIVGILDAEGYLVDIGILMGVQRESVSIYSRHQGAIKQMEAGYVKLSTSGSEIGFLK